MEIQLFKETSAKLLKLNLHNAVQISNPNEDEYPIQFAYGPVHTSLGICGFLLASQP